MLKGCVILKDKPMGPYI